MPGFRKTWDRHSLVTSRRMSRIAKDRYQRPAVVKTSARADSQKRRSPVPIQKSLAVPPLILRRVGDESIPWALILTTRTAAPSFERSARDWARRLNQSRNYQRELKSKIDRLRELEEQSPLIIPAAERWDKVRR